MSEKDLDRAIWRAQETADPRPKEYWRGIFEIAEIDAIRRLEAGGSGRDPGVQQPISRQRQSAG
jgi:hypothetical protein